MSQNMFNLFNHAKVVVDKLQHIIIIKVFIAWSNITGLHDNDLTLYYFHLHELKKNKGTERIFYLLKVKEVL